MHELSHLIVQGSVVLQDTHTHTHTHIRTHTHTCTHTHTRAHVLQGVPLHVGLNLEVKTAMPTDVPATPPSEVKRMVVPILACVERNTQGPPRSLYFSSFDPDVCVELKRRSRCVCWTEAGMEVAREAGEMVGVGVGQNVCNVR